MLVAVVALVHRDRAVAQHRLRPSRCHSDELVRAHNRIANLVQLSLDFFMFDFKIGDRRLATRTPVDDVLAPINQAFFVQPDEHLAHGARQVLIHGEVFAIPIHGSAQPLHLVENCSAVMPLPFPHALDKCLASEIATLLAFTGKLALNHHLGGNAGVVGAGKPQSEEPSHAVPAHDDVHLRLVQHVAHVQTPGNVGWRQQQREHRPRLSRRWSRHRKELFFDPVIGPARFNRAWLVRFG